MDLQKDPLGLFSVTRGLVSDMKSERKNNVENEEEKNCSPKKTFPQVLLFKDMQIFFHRIGPLGRIGLEVAMCVFGCLDV